MHCQFIHPVWSEDNLMSFHDTVKKTIRIRTTSDIRYVYETRYVLLFFINDNIC